MNREHIRNLFPEATDEAVKALLDINSADISHALNKQQGAHDELANQIKALNEQIVGKNAELTALTEKYEGQAKTTSEQNQLALAELQRQLEEATSKANTATALQKQVDRLTKDVAARDATIVSNDRRYRIRDELRDMKARNVDIVMKQLDLDKISEENGALVGLSEQVEALKQTDAYLFDTNTGNQRGGFAGAPEIGNSTDVNAAMNAAIRSASGRG